MTQNPSLHVDPPGDFIKDELQARGWDQTDLAFIIGVSPQQLNPVLSGKQNINAKWAQLFGDAFDVNPQFFINLQALYDLNNSVRPEPAVRIRADWVSKLPVREMIRRGWIEETEADLLDLQMMRFFRVNDKSDLPFVNKDAEVAHAAKKSSPYDEITPAQWAWLNRVRMIAESMEAPNYSRAALLDALPDVRAHMNDKDDFGQIPEILRQCGVRVVIVEALSSSKIDGVCTWIGDEPVIGLSLRLNRPDNLCFVLRHEIEHALSEDGKEITEHVDVFDEDRDLSSLPEAETRADAAAAEFLVPQDKLSSFMSRKGKWISRRDVLAFSSRHSIHPAIVVGQIQYRRFQKTKDKKAYAFLREYMTDVRECFGDWDYRDGWDHIAPVGL